LAGCVMGFHWKVHWDLGVPVFNIPYAPHRILVVGLGHLTRRGRLYAWLPSCYRLHLDYCCPARVEQVKEGL
jgi:hypothetical protein